MRKRKTIPEVMDDQMREFQIAAFEEKLNKLLEEYDPIRDHINSIIGKKFKEGSAKIFDADEFWKGVGENFGNIEMGEQFTPEISLREKPKNK